MDILSTSIGAVDGGTFAVLYKWRQNDSALPARGGTVSVTLNERYVADRPILAELSALHYLLCVKQVQGANRLGNGIALEVSAGAIDKAVAKGALKTTDKGKTDKGHIAPFCQFLATRFFEAEVSTVSKNKWKTEAAKKIEDFAISVDLPPVAAISRKGCDPESVVVSRHGMNRFIERYSAKAMIDAGATLGDIQNKVWTAAWRTLERILPQSVELKNIQKKEAIRILHEYGPGVRALHHVSTKNVFILKPERHGYVLVTTLVGDEYCRLIQQLPTYDCGRIRPARGW